MLRAAAMLLGIVYHAALSFAIGDAWMVRDVRQSKVLSVFQDFVHGFRMPLFILVSGFFTAMLWRQKGLKALLWHRCRRVLFPCLLGLVTVVPAMKGASEFATTSGAARRQRHAAVETASTDIWAAIRLGDTATLGRHLQAPEVLIDHHPAFGGTLLTWAALVGQQAAAETLIDRGGASPRGTATAALHCTRRRFSGGRGSSSCCGGRAPRPTSRAPRARCP